MRRSELQLEADSADRVCFALSRLANARSEAERQQANRWVLVWERYYTKMSGASSRTDYQSQLSTVSYSTDDSKIKGLRELARIVRRTKGRFREFFDVLHWIFRREQSMETRSQLPFDLSVSATR